MKIHHSWNLYTLRFDVETVSHLWRSLRRVSSSWSLTAALINTFGLNLFARLKKGHVVKFVFCCRSFFFFRFSRNRSAKIMVLLKPTSFIAFCLCFWKLSCAIPDKMCTYPLWRLSMVKYTTSRNFHFLCQYYSKMEKDFLWQSLDF